MVQELDIVLYCGLITVIAVYIFSIGMDIKKLKNNGTVYLTTTRGLNGAMIMVVITILSFSMIYTAEGNGIVEKSIIVISGVIVGGYWVYRAFSIQRLCENVIITHEYIYSVKDFRGYEWSSLVQEEGTRKLWIKVARKSLFGKEKVKEVYFILKNEQVHMIEELLNTWKK
ncbi:hypothetical protein [Cellulosilyticum sp. I15G10I2]|uniref:hypothetical protein n=1 Tax=Cellulosilyticum sp. I15G10I2 TaxID=1892843 RepID=UPI00085BD374|nr:hypothetical protein [Cellulosilyticum sp. I15G10I2]